MSRTTAGVGVAEVDNRATIGRTTAGISKYHGTDAELERLMHMYTRDVHSPAIARRAGVHLYRHFSFGPVQPDHLVVTGVDDQDADPSAQLTGAGHLDYLDESRLEAFYRTPDDEIRAHLLADIDVIGGPPGRTTTYRTSPGQGWTFVDRTGETTPQGPPSGHRVAVFLRSRVDEVRFRSAVVDVCRRWSRLAVVRRLRMQLFDEPDMTLEVQRGYPVHPAPRDEHYQAWLDLVLDGGRADLLSAPDLVEPLGRVCAAVHVQPVTVVYTYVWDGRPTVVGLRGYPAWELISRFGATNQCEPKLLAWMYGDHVAPQSGVL